MTDEQKLLHHWRACPRSWPWRASSRRRTCAAIAARRGGPHACSGDPATAPGLPRGRGMSGQGPARIGRPIWPFGKRTLKPGAWPARAGTWAAAGANTGKYVSPGAEPIQGYTTRSVAPLGLNGLVTGVFADGGVTLRVGPTGAGTSWSLDQAGISTSVGPTDTSTCAVYVGPMAIQSFLAAQSYAGGGDSIGLAGLTIDPGSFIWAVWESGTNGALATLNVTGTVSALAAPR